MQCLDEIDSIVTIIFLIVYNILYWGMHIYLKLKRNSNFPKEEKKMLRSPTDLGIYAMTMGNHDSLFETKEFQDFLNLKEEQKNWRK